MLDHAIEELLEHTYLAEVEDSPLAKDGFSAQTVRSAAESGFLTIDGQVTQDASAGGMSWRLTETGLYIARGVVRRHRLAERLLVDVLNVSGNQIDQGACHFEHILHEGLDDKVCSLLGHPKLCPHGKEIPPGECCRISRDDAIAEIRPLSDGKSKDEGVVAYLSTRDEREVQKLMALGILPGTRIRLLRRFPSFVFQVGYSQFTVDRRARGENQREMGVRGARRRALNVERGGG